MKSMPASRAASASVGSHSSGSRLSRKKVCSRSAEGAASVSAVNDWNFTASAPVPAATFTSSTAVSRLRSWLEPISAMT